MKKAKLSKKKVVKNAKPAKKQMAKKASVKGKSERVGEHTKVINGKRVTIKAFTRKPKS